jgi:hypothetical protein
MKREQRGLRRNQGGLSVVGLLLFGLVIVFLLIIGVKLIPAFTEYMAIEKALNAINTDSATVQQIRQDFGKRATIDDITSISANDLEITKEDDRVVISYAYSYSVPIVARARLVIDFAGSTRKRPLAP